MFRPPSSDGLDGVDGLFYPAPGRALVFRYLEFNLLGLEKPVEPVAISGAPLRAEQAIGTLKIGPATTASPACNLEAGGLKLLIGR